MEAGIALPLRLGGARHIRYEENDEYNGPAYGLRGRVSFSCVDFAFNVWFRLMVEIVQSEKHPEFARRDVSAFLCDE